MPDASRLRRNFRRTDKGRARRRPRIFQVGAADVACVHFRHRKRPAGYRSKNRDVRGGRGPRRVFKILLGQMRPVLQYWKRNVQVQNRVYNKCAGKLRDCSHAHLLLSQRNGNRVNGSLRTKRQVNRSADRDTVRVPSLSSDNTGTCPQMHILCALPEQKATQRVAGAAK